MLKNYAEQGRMDGVLVCDSSQIRETPYMLARVRAATCSRTSMSGAQGTHMHRQPLGAYTGISLSASDPPHEPSRGHTMEQSLLQIQHTSYTKTLSPSLLCSPGRTPAGWGLTLQHLVRVPPGSLSPERDRATQPAPRGPCCR